ncbi:MAG TPA: SCO1664 family protein [Aggregatilineales bacterium]|nr:SCO1664 family protein [Aggregatilineales bacterium]
MGEVPDERILHLLTCGAMREEHGMLRWSSNYTFLVSLVNEDQKMLAVYKPQRGERPLWDFPDGTLCYREVAAFVLSDALGWRVVPPTVLRDGLRGLGSVQVYINSDPDVNYFALDEGYGDQLRRVAAFDYMINNADRKGGHILRDGEGHLWGIDHGIGFHVAPKLRTVIWDFAGQPVPGGILDDVRRVSDLVVDPCTALRMELTKLLSEPEINALSARIRRLAQRGEFPRPGPGPNYPWPPV